MADTPRTLAEVKALLANNTSGDISAQDMRDLVESIVDPVPAGGFDYPIAATKVNQILSFNPTASLTLGTGVSYRTVNLSTGTSLYDPMGAIQTGSYTSSYLGSQTFTAGQWFRLPAGVWMMEVTGIWDSNTDGERIAEVIHIDSRQTLAGETINPLFGAPNEWQMMSSVVYHKATTIPANGYAGLLSFFIVTPEMIAANHVDSPSGSDWAFGTQFWQNSGTDRTLNGFALVVARIA